VRVPFTFTITRTVSEEDDVGGEFYEAEEEIEVTLPGKNVVCSQCEGTGTMVNPAIDGNGLTSDDFAEDPDFREDYFAGAFDQACSCCHGHKLIVEPDESYRNQPAYASAWRAYEQYLDDKAFESRQRAEDAYTRRMENGGY
jgi:hypothetical protein